MIQVMIFFYRFNLSLWEKLWKHQPHLCASQFLGAKNPVEELAVQCKQEPSQAALHDALSGHFSQRGASLAPQKALATEPLKTSRRAPSAPAVRASTQPCRWDRQLQRYGGFPPAASLEETLRLKAFTNLPSRWKQYCLISWFAMK